MTATLSIPSPPMARRPRNARLTPRQREVISLIAEGRTNKEIASTLNIAVHTVKTHVHTVLTTLQLRSRLELAIMVHAGSRDADVPQLT